MIKHLLTHLKGNSRRYGLLLSLFVLGTIGALALGDAYLDAGLSAPTVTSDKDDYAPGEIAHITGSGWTLDQQVHVEFKEYPDYPDYHIYDVNVDANGNWKIDYQVEARHIGVKFTVTSKGAQTGFLTQTVFTDANVEFSATGLSGTPKITANYTITNTATKALLKSGFKEFVFPSKSEKVPVNKGETITATFNDVITSGGIVYSASTVSWDSKTDGENTQTLTAAYSVAAKRDPSITWSTPGNITYGTALSTIQLNATADVAGSFTYSPTLETILKAGSNQTLSVTFTPDNTTNYNTIVKNISINVNKAELTYKANPVSRLYGVENPTLGGTVIGFVNNENQASSTTGTLTFGSTTTSTTAVGSYAIIGSGLSATNYTFKQDAENVNALTITQVQPVITWSDPAKIVYGTELSATQLNATTGVAGTFAYNPAAGTKLTAGTHELTVTFSPTDAANYKTATGKVSITVEKADQVITWSTPAAIIYGTALSATQLNATALDGAGLTYSPEPGTVLDAGSHTLTVNAAETNNYKANSHSVTLTIKKAPVTLAFGELDFTYDGTLKSATATATPNVSGLTVTGSGTNADEYAATASLTNDNYEATPITGTLKIAKAKATIVVAGYEGVYDAKAHGATGTATGVNGEDLSSLLNLGATFTNVTNGTASWIFAGDKNYDNANGTAAIAISARNIKVTADAQSKTYGNADPALTYKITAGELAGSDKFAGTLSRVAGEDAGTYAINQGSLALNDNYNLAYTGANLTITPAVLTITAADDAREYGEPNPAFTGTFTGAKNGETFTVGGSSTATATSPVGTYAIVPSVTGATLANYDVVQYNGTFTIKKAELAVTTAAKSKVYGDAFTDFTGSISGIKNSDNITATYSSTGAAATAAAGNYPIVAALNDTDNKLGNYTIINPGATLTVDKASLTVTANPASKVYGSINPAFAVTYAGFVNNDAATNLDGALTYATTATAASPVGTYDVTPSGLIATNYNISFVKGILTVTPATLTVVAGNASKIYGDANPDFTGSITGIQNNDAITPSYASAATVESPVGNYDIVPAVSGDALSNYNVAKTNGTLTVTKAALTVKTNPQTKIYGDEFTDLTGSIEGIKNNDNITVTYGSAGAPAAATVNTYAIVATLLDPTSKSGNYTVTNAGNTLTVNKASLTATADDASKTYGAANPTFTGKITGIKNNDAITATYSTVAPAASSVGTYAIIPAVAADKLTNYSVTLVNGTLTIGKADLTITAKAATKVYGEANPEFTVSHTGFVNKDDAADLSGTLSFATDATAASAIGSYDVIPSGLTSNNYSISFEKGTLIITKAALTIVADNATKVYGDENPKFTGTLTGVKNSDAIMVNYTSAASATSAVGSYPITASAAGDKLSNYDVKATNGLLTITARPVSITADTKTKVYGAADPALTYAIATGNLVNKDTFTGALIREAGEHVGTYAIKQGTVALSNNYDLSFTGASLTITKKAASVVVAAQTKVYGTADPTFAGTLTGFLDADHVTAAYSRETGETVAGGPYAITATLSPVTVLSNYDITNSPAALSITTRPVTIAADAETKTYGEVDPQLTYAISEGSLAFSDKFTGVLTRATGENVGTYAIIQGSVALSNNYALTYAGANLTITTAPLSIKANASNKLCGQNNPAFSVTYTGFVNGDDAADLSGTLTFATEATAISTVGSFDVIPSGLTSGNYTITFAKGILTIEGVTADASVNSTPQAVKTTATNVIVKVTTLTNTVAANVPVNLYFDNSSTPLTVISDASGIATFNVGVLETGVYTVRAVAGSGCSESIAYLPVYDPNGGFVTGGGWIESPVVPATSTTCPTCTFMRVGGKANFGFVAKYKKGLTEVDGNTEFNFKAGDLNFKSLLHEGASLVVTPTKAIYKGTGSINGIAGYSFMVSAIDGSPDRFRIKIWETVGLAVVYDNQAGAAENADATTAIGGGSIVIQQATTKKSERVADAADMFTGVQASFKAYPNPVRDNTTIEFAFAQDETYSLEVYNVQGELVKKLPGGQAKANTPVQVKWDAANAAAGVYIVRLVTNSGVQNLRMVRE